MSSRLRRVARTCAITAPVLVTVTLASTLAATGPPWPVSVLVLVGGVVAVTRRRGLEPGAYTALLSSAALAAVRARQAGTGTGASGRLLVGATTAFLCVALVADRRRPRFVSRLHEPSPLSPDEPGGRAGELPILNAFLARPPMGRDGPVGRLAVGPTPDESRQPCPTPSSGS